MLVRLKLCWSIHCFLLFLCFYVDTNSPFWKGHIHSVVRQQLLANVSLINVINVVDSGAAAVLPGQPPDSCQTGAVVTAPYL